MTTPVPTIGVDVGGANIKAAHSDGSAQSLPFALWQRPADLPAMLHRVCGLLPPAQRLAVTMTGELCDCFATKADGVRVILDAVARVAGARPVRVLQNDGRLVGIKVACENALKTAAANWLALAVFAGRLCESGCGLVIDVGSTTTDIIPLVGGRPEPRGRTDPERLASGELVYTGVRRTPICALVRELPWRGHRCRVAAELFATTCDVYVLAGDLPEDPHDHATADGRPTTRACASARLARIICADETIVTDQDIYEIVEVILRAQVDFLRAACEQVTATMAGAPTFVVVSGKGEFLAGKVVHECFSAAAPFVDSISRRFGPAASEAACAFALARLAAESEDSWLEP